MPKHGEDEADRQGESRPGGQKRCLRDAGDNIIFVPGEAQPIAAGAVAFTDGDKSVTNAQVMRRALTYARDFDALIVHHTEDPDLVGEGVMNEGEFATRLGLAGIPNAAESIMLERDMHLAALTGGRYHAASLTSIESLEILKREAETDLLVVDGHTAVIGGIFTRNTGRNVDQVPFFGDIPILGILFQRRRASDTRNELVIFLTPRLVR